MKKLIIKHEQQDSTQNSSGQTKTQKDRQFTPPTQTQTQLNKEQQLELLAQDSNDDTTYESNNTSYIRKVCQAMFECV